MGENAGVTRLRHRCLTGGSAPSRALDQNVPPSAPCNHVFVTGAGFTRASVPEAPLLVDDFLDEALSGTGRWTPEWGYGFFCRTSLDAVSAVHHRPPRLGPRLLRLHGCVNWRPRLGHSEPFALDSIVHHHEWEGNRRARYPLALIAQHLESEPVIVPPVLAKSGLLAEPVLRLVWTLAFETLTTAEKVTFIGYSFPSTDLAARTLFSEALRDLPRENIRVVDLATEEADIVRFKSRYRGVLGEIPDHRCSFTGLARGFVPWPTRRPIRKPRSPLTDGLRGSDNRRHIDNNT